MKLRLIIIRHGETFANLNKLNQGQTDSELTQKGINQAKKTGEYLKRLKIDEFYSSDLKRTSNTTKEISKFHENAKIHHKKELRELNLGILENTPYNKDKDILKLGIKDMIYKPKNGESMFELYLRIKKFIKRLIKKELKEKNNKTIALITHGGVIVCMLLYLLKEKRKNYAKYVVGNLAINILEISKKKIGFSVKSLLINSTSHLMEKK